jgi:hypothetical protein
MFDGFWFAAIRGMSGGGVKMYEYMGGLVDVGTLWYCVISTSLMILLDCSSSVFGSTMDV